MMMRLGQVAVIKDWIENSHRVLILLTAEFIKDDWSLFALQEVE